MFHATRLKSRTMTPAGSGECHGLRTADRSHIGAMRTPGLASDTGPKSPQREQQGCALHSPPRTAAEYADYTAVVSLGVKVFCGLAMVVIGNSCDVPYTRELYSIM